MAGRGLIKYLSKDMILDILYLVKLKKAMLSTKPFTHII